MLKTFAQAYSSYGYPYQDNMLPPELLWTGVIISIIVIVLILASLWRIFTKAGRPGWQALIPIYNMVVLLQIVGRPVWWIVLFLVGFVPIIGNIIAAVASIIVSHDTAKSFGKDIGYTILLIFLPIIGYPMLAFGNAKYKGPSAASPTKSNARI